MCDIDGAPKLATEPSAPSQPGAEDSDPHSMRARSTQLKRSHAQVILVMLLVFEEPFPGLRVFFRVLPL